MTPVRGRIGVNPRGFGFLVTEEPEPRSAFVAPPDLNRFLEGDIVRAAVATDSAGRSMASSLVLEQRVRREVFGTVTTRGKRPHLAIDRAVANTDWPFAEGTADGLAEGTALLARVGDGVVTPHEILPAGADLAVARCLARHGLRGDHGPALVEEAKRAKASLRLGPRRDLRELPTVTIDAASTTDIDDALSALPALPSDPDGALRVLVSIADVDAFVPEGSPLDEEARVRGTSVYLAGKTVPMLPDVLSSDAASLLEGAERPTLTVELRIDAEGHVTSTDVYESLLRSHARLTYDAVSAFFDGDEGAIPEGVATTVRWLRTAAARISAHRAARGGTELAREEAFVSVDRATGEPTAVEARADTPAHRLVERLMVAANEAVARWLVERGLPGVFRVHPPPTAERVARLADFAKNFGIEAGFARELTPRGLTAFEAQLVGSRLAPAVRLVLARALGPARYAAEPGLHFGLAAPLYLHFTSPIRRYADLAVHRIVKRYLRGDRSMTATVPALGELCQQITDAARASDKAETERRRMLVARLFGSRIGEERGGYVIAVKPFGLVVQLEGTGVTGTVATEVLPDGPYDADLARERLISGTRSFSVGDTLRVRIAAANEELGRIELVLAEGQGTPKRAVAKRGAPRSPKA